MVRLSDGSVVNNSSLYHKYNKGEGGGPGGGSPVFKSWKMI